MLLSTSPRSNLIGAGNAARRVLVGRGGGDLGEISRRCGAGEGRSAASIMPDRADQAGPEVAEAASGPISANQALSAADRRAVAQDSSHGAPESADFCASRLLRGLMASYRTGRRTRADRAQLEPAAARTGQGVRPPSDRAAGLSGRRAGATWDLRKPARPAGPAPECTAAAPVNGAKQANSGMGSGVRDAEIAPISARERRERERLGWNRVGVVREFHSPLDHAGIATLGRGLG
jgi:hypothetical protein